MRAAHREVRGYSTLGVKFPRATRLIDGIFDLDIQLCFSYLQVSFKNVFIVWLFTNLKITMLLRTKHLKIVLLPF